MKNNTIEKNYKEKILNVPAENTKDSKIKKPDETNHQANKLLTKILQNLQDISYDA